MHLTLRRAFAVLLVLSSLLCLLSCQMPNARPDDATERIVLTDALGRRVNLPKHPERVAALLGSFADVWRLAGGTLCAAPHDAAEDFDIDMSGMTDLGGAHSPDLELLIAANPDLVLASASTSSNVALLDTLERLGMTVVYFDVDCFKDYLYMLDVCTALTERRDLYEESGVALRTRIDTLERTAADDGRTNDERTVLLLRASASHVRAKGSSGTILGEMLHDLGCINLADANASLLDDLSLESIIRQQPYHIFIVTMGDDTEAARQSITKMMEENPAWYGLEAVKGGRVHYMDKHLYNLKPNARWAYAYEELYEILAP